MVSEKFSRIRELYEIGGWGRVARGIRDYLYHLFRNITTSDKTYQQKRADINDRWEFIQPYIDTTSTILDIGCAEGYYTVRAAEVGGFAIGIDSRSERLEQARKQYGFPDKTGFAKLELTPENIHTLPNVDTIFLLTVQHHWEANFGLKDAEMMFQYVMDRCDTLIYEPPGDRPIIRSKEGILDPEQSISYYRSRLSALYGNSIEICDSTLTKFRVDEKKYLYREDPIFVIDTSDFDIKQHKYGK